MMCDANALDRTTCAHTPPLTKTGDPYEFQIRANFEVVREHFLSLNYSNVTIAFQNHGGKGTKVSH